MRSKSALAIALLAAVFAGASAQAQPAPAGDYLFVWAADVGAKRADFLAVIDSDPTSAHYAEVVATVPTSVANARAHHTEHAMPEGGKLFANAFAAGKTFVFDLRDPRRPKLETAFENAGDFMHPHSFARTPKGSVLATFQMRGHDNAEPGALVELSPSGEVLRVSPAADPEAEPFIRPYSLAVVESLDRVVTSSADMHGKDVSHSIQIWRLSDLKLLHTVRLPAGPKGDEEEDPAEPRVLADGRTVAVSTFNCGMYLLGGIDGPAPSAQFIHSFDGGQECALPVVTGRYWVATSLKHGLIALDMADPRKPVEVSRLALPGGQGPHWISLAPDGRRIVVSGGKLAHETRILLVTIDSGTGKLTLDESFRDKGSTTPGVSFDRASWPHGATGKALPHGAVFSRPSHQGERG
ncbi:MAG: hypothetical protein ABIS39_02365 [Sphingomicrobium sp.]